MANAAKTPVAALTNGQLYDEWNAACFARLRRETVSTEYQARLDAIEAELSIRPAEEGDTNMAQVA